MLSQYPFWHHPWSRELWHVGDCYYVESAGADTMTVRQILLSALNPRAICDDCLRQLAAIQKHLRAKGIPYVHGHLTVDTVVRSVDGRYFIVDNGVTKQTSATDPFAHYCDLDGDLRKLKQSMDECLRMDTVLKARLYNGRLHFEPVESI